MLSKSEQDRLSPSKKEYPELNPYSFFDQGLIGTANLKKQPKDLENEATQLALKISEGRDVSLDTNRLIAMDCKLYAPEKRFAR